MCFYPNLTRVIPQPPFPNFLVLGRGQPGNTCADSRRLGATDSARFTGLTPCAAGRGGKTMPSPPVAVEQYPFLFYQAR